VSGHHFLNSIKKLKQPIYFELSNGTLREGRLREKERDREGIRVGEKREKRKGREEEKIDVERGIEKSVRERNKQRKRLKV